MRSHSALGQGGSWLLWLPMCVLPLCAMGQMASGWRTAAESFPYSVVSLGTNARLPQSQVASMAIHPTTKEIVISTAKGLVSYDGRTINPYDIGDAYDRHIFGKMFSSNLYNAPLGMGFGELVVLSEKPRSLGSYTAAYIQEDEWITADGRGQLLWREPETNAWMYAETGLTDVQFISLIGKDSILLGHPGGTYLYNRSHCSMVYLMHEVIRAAAFDSLNHEHYLVGDRLLRLASSGLTVVDMPEMAGLSLHSIAYVEGSLLLSSNQGLFIRQGQRLELYSERDVLPTNTIDQILYDPVSQAVFIATGDRGLLRLLKKRFTSYFTMGSESLGSSSSVVVWRGQHVFVGNHLNVVGMYGDDSIYVKTSEDVPVFSLSLIGDTLFVGRSDGVNALLVEGGEKLYKSAPCNCFVRAVHRDRQGVYWVGTSSGLWRGKSMHTLKPAQSIFKNVEVTSILESSQGDLWFGSRVYTVVLDKYGHIKHDFSAQNFRFAYGARAFYEDKKGGIWIGTYGGGLLYYKDNRLVALKDMPGYLLGDDIFTLVPDKYGYWIMTSNDGVRIVQEKAAEQFLQGKLDYLVPYYFGADDGIHNPEFNGGFLNNYGAIGKDVFYFPSIKGVVRYRARELLQRENTLMFQRILIDKQAYRQVKNVPRTTRFLEFEFSDVSFDPSSNVYYQYRLLGETNELPAWSAPQKSLSVVLSYLKPGNYSIQFRSIDASNRANPPYVTYDFYVESHFYETNWFYACGILFFSLLTFLGVTFSQKRRQKRMEYESSMRNTITEMQLGAIQSQMNPHFIFNALNVLVYLISFSSVDKARSFAVSFSLLLRKILEQSDKTFLSVEEEIETLKAYMHIQKERLSLPLSFDVHCPPALLTKEIPTMLIQPLLENAVIHGIAHADWPGMVELVFEEMPAGIQITITDNGIGRQRSQEINKSKVHSSKGMELVKKKTDLLRAKYNLEVIMEVQDHPDNNVQGTVVTIRIAALLP